MSSPDALDLNVPYMTAIDSQRPYSGQMILLSIFYEIMYEFTSKFLAIRKILEKKVCGMDKILCHRMCQMLEFRTEDVR